jgi:hypothetical protein
LPFGCSVTLPSCSVFSRGTQARVQVCVPRDCPCYVCRPPTDGEAWAWCEGL